LKKTVVADVQELLSYLEHIRRFWYFVFDGNERDMESLDQVSLKALELHAPGACEAEARTLYGRVCAGEVLGTFSSQQRQAIWTKICYATADCLIPSLSGFFEDIKHLKLVADSVKWLLRLTSKETIRSGLDLSFSNADDEQNMCLVQTSGSLLRSIPVRETGRFNVSYRVLWLYALREYPDIPAVPQRKLAGPGTGQVNERVLFEFALLAHKLGFRSEQIKTLLERDPDREIARRLLLTAREPDRFQFRDLEGSVTEVMKLIRSAHPICDSEIIDEDNLKDAGIPLRSGRPKLPDHLRDKPYLFLDTMHGDVVCGSAVTSFFIQRSTYFAFFGKQLSVDVADITSSNVMHETITSIDSNQLQNDGTIHHSNLAPNREGSSENPVAPNSNVPQDTFQQQRLESLNRMVEEQEAKLERLIQIETEQQENLERLQTVTLEQEKKLADAERDDRQLQEKLKTMRLLEADQVIRLESLKADEEKRRTVGWALEQTQYNLSEEIRLDLLTTAQREEVICDEEGQLSSVNQFPVDTKNRERTNQLSLETAERHKMLDQLKLQTTEQQTILSHLNSETDKQQNMLDQLSLQTDEQQTMLNHLSSETDKQQTMLNQLRLHTTEQQNLLNELLSQVDVQRNSLGQLADTECEKKGLVEQLELEEQRLRKVVAELSKNIDEAEQAKAVREKEHYAAVNNLVARELQLRGHIDQLEVCSERLQAKIDRAATEETQSETRIDRLVVAQKQQNVALERLDSLKKQSPHEKHREEGQDSLSINEQLDEVTLAQKERRGSIRLEQLIRTGLDFFEDGDGQEGSEEYAAPSLQGFEQETTTDEEIKAQLQQNQQVSFG
jgi:hypothetical protein